jgi:DNA-directed RNA polymerase specialized sigma24 family protein
MQTLDRLLYAWLSEQDHARFERAFGTYFCAAFPAIVRYLARRAVFDQLQLEDLAQETLLKFFERIGRRRRGAFATTARSLPQVQPVRLSPLHDRQVGMWSTAVGAFANDALQFAVRAGELTAGSDWKSILREVSDRAPGLHRQGCHLLYPLQSACVIPDAGDSVPADSASEPDLEELRDFCQRMVQAGRHHTAAIAEAEQRYPGLVPFVHATWVVTEAVPELRIPTNSFLFEIARSLYLDECKSRGRKKRGGSGVSAEFNSGSERHPLEAPEDSELSQDSSPDDEGQVGFGVGSLVFAHVPSQRDDPNLTYEDEQFLEKFYDYLQRPVEQAQAAYAQAATAGAQKAARKRLESLTDKFSRLTAVLSLLGEGHTQDAIAERLKITRNQVKYVVESVQESYLQFSARTIERAQQTPAIEEPAHVK